MHHCTNWIRWLLPSIVLSLSAGPASAGQCAGVTLPEQVSIEGKPLVLNGMGLREATVLAIDVYVAGLYLERRSKDGKAIAASEQLKQMRLSLLRAVDRD